MLLNPIRSVLTEMLGWRLERTRADDMHCTKLGVAPHVIANTLAYMCETRAYRVFPPVADHVLSAAASWQDMLRDYELRFKKWLRQHKLSCSCHYWTTKAIKRENNTEYPTYRCKAAQSPIIVAFLAELSLEFSQRAPSHEANLVSACTWGLAQYFLC